MSACQTQRLHQAERPPPTAMDGCGVKQCGVEQWCLLGMSSRAASINADRCMHCFRHRMVSCERMSDVIAASSRATSANGDGWMWCEAVWCGAVVSAGCVEPSCLHQRRQMCALLLMALKPCAVREQVVVAVLSVVPAVSVVSAGCVEPSCLH